MQYKLEIIKWIDAVQDIGHYPIEDIPKLVCQEMSTVGWVVNENDLQVVIAQTTGQDSVANLLAVPKGCIMSRTGIISVKPLDDINLKVNEEYNCICCTNVPNIRVLPNRKNQIKVHCGCGFIYMYDIIEGSMDPSLCCPKCGGKTYKSYSYHSGGHFNATVGEF